MDSLGTILAVVASVVTIAGGIVGVLRYLEHVEWGKNRGRASVVIGSVTVAVLTVITGSTLAVLQHEKQPTPPPAGGACARLADFSTATSPALGSAFGSVAFPPDSLTSNGGFFEISDYQFEVLHVCITSLTDANAVRSYYQADMPYQGWTASSTFPLDGDANHPCAEGQSSAVGDMGALCWSQDARLVSLQGVTAVRNGSAGAAPVAVTYDLLLSVAPVTSSGTITIARNSTYAFEDKTVDAGDIQWRQRGSGIHTVGPANGATLAYVGQQDFTGLRVSVLKNMLFGTGALSVGVDGGLTVGDVFGVYTTNQHYVKVQVVGAASDLRITWVLYPYLLD